MVLPDEERCTALVDGHRCMRRKHATGPHDPSLVLWIDVVNYRRRIVGNGPLGTARRLWLGRPASGAREMP